MRNYIASIIILAAIAASWGCSSFYIAKEGSGSCAFGDTTSALYKTLCGGDLIKILADTKLPQGAKDDIYKYNCSPTDRSRNMAKQTVSSLTNEQRVELKQSFIKHGYKVNPSL